MSSSSSPVLTLELKWSHQRQLLLVLQLLMCIAVPMLLPRWSIMPRIGMGAMALAVVAVGGYRMGWWSRHRPVCVTWQSSGQWQVDHADGRRSEGKLLGSSQVTAAFVCIHLSFNGPTPGTRRLLLLRGEYPAGVWRRLQARLRLEGRRDEPADTAA